MIARYQKSAVNIKENIPRLIGDMPSGVFTDLNIVVEFVLLFELVGGIDVLLDPPEDPQYEPVAHVVFDVVVPFT